MAPDRSHGGLAARRTVTLPLPAGVTGTPKDLESTEYTVPTVPFSAVRLSATSAASASSGADSSSRSSNPVAPSCDFGTSSNAAPTGTPATTVSAADAGRPSAEQRAPGWSQAGLAASAISTASSESGATVSSTNSSPFSSPHPNTRLDWLVAVNAGRRSVSSNVSPWSGGENRRRTLKVVPSPPCASGTSVNSAFIRAGTVIDAPAARRPSAAQRAPDARHGGLGARRSVTGSSPDGSTRTRHRS